MVDLSIVMLVYQRVSISVGFHHHTFDHGFFSRTRSPNSCNAHGLCLWPHRLGHVERVEPSNFGVNCCLLLFTGFWHEESTFSCIIYIYISINIIRYTDIYIVYIHTYTYILYIYIHTYFAMTKCPKQTSFWKITFRNMARRALVFKFSCLGWLVVTIH